MMWEEMEIGGSKRNMLQSIFILLLPSGRGLGSAGAARTQQLQRRQCPAAQTHQTSPASSHASLQPAGLGCPLVCLFLTPIRPSFLTTSSLISAILFYSSSKLMLPPNIHPLFVSFLVQSPALYDY